MSEPLVSINLPRWDGEARSLGTCWQLSKGTHVAVCTLWTYPVGAEIRALNADELWRTQADRDLL